MIQKADFEIEPKLVRTPGFKARSDALQDFGFLLPWDRKKGRKSDKKAEFIQCY